MCYPFLLDATVSTALLKTSNFSPCFKILFHEVQIVYLASEKHQVDRNTVVWFNGLISNTKVITI